MAGQALRQADLFQDAAEVWKDRLLAAFADRRSRVLPLAEQAIAACPADMDLLLLAATAAVLDKRPDWALGFLDQYSKGRKALAAHVLHALALIQLNKRDAAKALLSQHGLSDLRAALSAFPIPLPSLLRSIGPLDDITMGPSTAPIRPPRAL